MYVCLLSRHWTQSVGASKAHAVLAPNPIFILGSCRTLLFCKIPCPLILAHFPIILWGNGQNSRDFPPFVSGESLWSCTVKTRCSKSWRWMALGCRAGAQAHSVTERALPSGPCSAGGSQRGSGCHCSEAQAWPRAISTTDGCPWTHAVT